MCLWFCLYNQPIYSVVKYQHCSQVLHLKKHSIHYICLLTYIRYTFKMVQRFNTLLAKSLAASSLQKPQILMFLDQLPQLPARW